MLTKKNAKYQLMCTIEEAHVIYALNFLKNVSQNRRLYALFRKKKIKINIYFLCHMIDCSLGNCIQNIKRDTYTPLI